MIKDSNASVREHGGASEEARALSLWEMVVRITERGNNAEVKRKKDGSFTVYEVKKNIVTV